MLVLTQFILRLTFGMALGMALTPSRLVSSGYYRNNLYVLLGFNVLAALISWSAPADTNLVLWPPLAAAVLSYIGAVSYLYERAGVGLLSLILVSVTALVGAWLDRAPLAAASIEQNLLAWLDPIGEGLVLGITMAAMLLGHWYLNAPGMRLESLRRLVLLMAAAVLLRAVLSGTGLGLEVATQSTLEFRWWLMIALRWLAGLFGTLGVAWAAWQTLKIPNTQSATGILYVGVITTFLGELTAQLLSRDSLFPL